MDLTCSTGSEMSTIHITGEPKPFSALSRGKHIRQQCFIFCLTDLFHRFPGAPLWFASVFTPGKSWKWVNRYFVPPMWFVFPKLFLTFDHNTDQCILQARSRHLCDASLYHLLSHIRSLPPTSYQQSLHVCSPEMGRRQVMGWNDARFRI